MGQLLAGLAILQYLDNFDPTPAGVLTSGVVDSNNQTYQEWADKVNLPLFTNYSLVYQNGKNNCFLLLSLHIDT